MAGQDRRRDADSRTEWLSATTAGDPTRSWSKETLFSPVTANPSLTPRANGLPQRAGWRYAAHTRNPGPGILPLPPA